MHKSNSIKVNANLEANGDLAPNLQRYATRLRALDKDGNGEIDMNEICGLIDATVAQEKETRLMKKLAMLFGLLSLLTIAAVVGLTYAVVVLSQDTGDTNNVLVSKNSGLPMSTASYTGETSFADILKDPTPYKLNSISSLVVPGNELSRVNYTIYNVDATAVNLDGSVTFSLANGKQVNYKLDKDGSIVLTPLQSTETAAGRKLQSSSADGTAIDNANSAAEVVKCAATATNDQLCANSCAGCVNTKYPPVDINPMPPVTQ